MKNRRPAIIDNILTRLETFVITKCLYGRAHIWRRMRPERQQSILILLAVLAKSCCLAYDGAFVRVVNGVAYPLTIKEMSRLSGLPIWTVNRCLADLRELGFIQSGKQIILPGQDGEVVVTAVMRKFTKAFYVALGLWGQFVEGVKYATAHSKLKISWAFHAVKNKAAKAIKSALAPAKVPKDEADKERYRKNQTFLAYLECSSKHDHQGCLGGYSSEAVCAVCRRMRAGGKA